MDGCRCHTAFPSYEYPNLIFGKGNVLGHNQTQLRNFSPAVCMLRRLGPEERQTKKMAFFGSNGALRHNGAGICQSDDGLEIPEFLRRVELS